MKDFNNKMEFSYMLIEFTPLRSLSRTLLPCSDTAGSPLPPLIRGDYQQMLSENKQGRFRVMLV